MTRGTGRVQGGGREDKRGQGGYKEGIRRGQGGYKEGARRGQGRGGTRR